MTSPICKDQITQAELHRLFHYGPETGVLTWRVSRSNRTRAGMVAGYESHGYRQVQIHGRAHSVHRLLWCYVHGAWPPVGLQIDHRNHVRDDNRIKNLRLATNGQNKVNTPGHRNNTSGGTGVSWYPSRQKWLAYVNNGEGRIHLGYFTEKADAIAARAAAVQKYHGEFAYQGAAA